MKLAIIIPAHNEEKRIRSTLELYSSYFEHLRKNSNRDFDYLILVVINAAKDNTEKIVKEFTKKSERISYLNLIKGGKGYAVIEGFKYALNENFDFIGFVDADAATPPQAFHSLLVHLLNEKADGAIASRYLNGSVIIKKQSKRRILSSRIYNIFIRTFFLLPYRDTQCGAKIFKRQALEKTIHLFTMSQWAFDLDILYAMRKRGFNIIEVPTIWSEKDFSQINFFKSGIFMALGVFRLRLLHSPFKFIVHTYDKILDLFRKI